MPNSSHMTGYQVAVGMLSYYGIEGVQVHRGGADQNFFYPKDNSVTLSYDVFDGLPISSNSYTKVQNRITAFIPLICEDDR